MLLTVITPTADILGNPQEPHMISQKDSQLLYGEQFHVEESHGAYVYGYSTHDHYKGYVERDQLIKNAPEPNAFVTTKSTHIYTEPNFKSRPVEAISFLSRLSVTKTTADNFTQLADGQWVYTKHIQTLVDTLDLADIASLYIGTPYLFGGRSMWGIDCAGLVQNALIAKGYTDIPIVYFKGHVGIMLNKTNILNATARHMTTVVEKLSVLEKDYDGITHIIRV